MKPYALILLEPLTFIKFMDAPTDVREGYGIVPYTKDPEPVYNKETHKLTTNRNVTLNGVTDEWSVVALTEGETKLVNFHKAIVAGYDTGLGFSLKMGDYDRTQFTQLLAAVNEFLSAGAMTLNSEIDIWDTQGIKHTVTVAIFKQLIMGLSAYYLQINTAKE